MAVSSLRQALAQRVADAFDDDDGHEKNDEDHAETVVLAPADLLIHNETETARAHVAEDGRIAHVALQAEQGHGQICRQHLREDGGDERAQPRRAEGLQRLIRAHIDRFNDLKELLADIGKRKDRNGTGAGHGAETEDVGSDQRAHERRQRADKAQKEPHNEYDDAVRNDIACRGDSERDGQHRADERAEKRHFDRVPQRRPDFGEIGGVRREHGLENVEKLAAALYEHGEIKPRHAHGDRRERHHDENNDRRAAAFFLHDRSVRERVGAGLEHAVIETHAGSSVSSSP